MRQQFFNLAILVCRQASQHILQIGVRIMPIELGALNQTHHRRAPAHSPAGIRKSPIARRCGYLKKSLGLLCPRTPVSYQLVEQLQKKAVSVSQACRVLQVSPSSYYAARLRSRQAPVVCADSVHLKAAFAASGRAYGSRRLCAALQKQGVAIGRHRVRTLMRANGLRPV